MVRKVRLVLSLLLLSGAGVTAQASLGGVRRFPSSPEQPRPRQTWVVDAGGTGDFTDLQRAINTVAAGDVLLLRSDLAIDRTVAIVGKTLTLIGDGSDVAIRRGPLHPPEPLLEISSLSASDRVVLRNLTLSGTTNPSEFAGSNLLLLDQNAGAIWMEDCRVGYPTMNTLTASGGAWTGIAAIDCSSLVMIRTTVSAEGGFGGNVFGGGGGLGLVDSTMHVYESTVAGPNGGRSLTTTGSGGVGASLRNSFLFATHSSFQGGAGGACACRLRPGSGGTGLASDVDSDVHAIACTIQGGAAGTPFCSFGPDCAPGFQGLDVVAFGFFENLPAPLRTYELTAPSAAPGSNLTLRATAPAGELVVSLISDAPASIYLPQHQGVQLLAAPLQIISEGTVPAGGVLTKSIPVPPLPALVTIVQTFRQGFFFDASGAAFLSSASAVLAMTE